MLFFIIALHHEERGTLDLNTSHVILYLRERMMVSTDLQDLNTSHVILYPAREHYERTHIVFKYISCYSLSRGRRMECFIFFI